MEITWDPEKERKNVSKHGLDFSFAAKVFADPLAVTVFDRVQDGEERWHTIAGVGGSFTVLLVVHTFPDPDDAERVHIIGLGQATPHERRRYEEEGGT